MAYEQTYRLRTQDFDCNDQMHPAAILDLFQDVAGWDVQEKGFGTRELLERHGLLWVVVRSKYEVVAAPAPHALVTARTWTDTPTRLGFRRESQLLDEAGTLLVKGTADWIMMDAKTRSFASVLDVWPDGGDGDARKNFESKLKKLRSFEAQGAAHRVVPVWSDLDANGHVNNTRYASFVMDALGCAADSGRKQRVKSMQIDYRRELRLGQAIDVVSRIDGQTARAAGIMSDSGEQAFSAAIELF